MFGFPPALKTSGFACYVLANFVSQMGTWIQRVAIGWLSWDLTHSALLVGLTSLLLFSPTLIFGPMFGAIADRADVRKASVIANIVLSLIAVLFCLVQYFGWMTFQVLALLAVIQGLASAAYQPVRISIIPDLVPQNHLVSAIAINSVGFNLSRLLGPVASGFLISGSNVSLAFAANMASALPLLAVVAALRMPGKSTGDKPRTPSIIADILEAIRFLKSNSLLSQQLAVTALTSALGRGPLELLPAFAATIFDKGPSGLAWLMSSIGAGALAAGLILATIRSNKTHSFRTAYMCAILVGVLTGLLSVTRHAAWILAVMFCLGLTTTFLAIVSQTVLQSHVTTELRGRVASIWVTVSLGSPAVAGLILGFLGDLVGIRPMLAAAGVGCIACALALYRRAQTSIA